MKEVVPPYPSDVKEAPLTLLEKPLQIAVNTPLILATYKTATGSNGWSGKAVISYLGPIS